MDSRVASIARGPEHLIETRQAMMLPSFIELGYSVSRSMSVLQFIVEITDSPFTM